MTVCAVSTGSLWRSRQAHAWAEVYPDGVGWIPVEVTPGAEAFPDDNTMEQLELTGQLTDTFESMPEPPEVTEEPSQDQTGADDGRGTTGNGTHGAGEAGNGNGGTDAAGNGSAGNGMSGNAGGKAGVQKPQWELSPQAKAWKRRDTVRGLKRAVSESTGSRSRSSGIW